MARGLLGVPFSSSSLLSAYSSSVSVNCVVVGVRGCGVGVRECVGGTTVFCFVVFTASSSEISTMAALMLLVGDTRTGSKLSALTCINDTFSPQLHDPIFGVVYNDNSRADNRLFEASDIGNNATGGDAGGILSILSCRS